MGIKIGNYNFDGPFTDANSLRDLSGVYVILCYSSQITVVDVGESANVKTRVENHDRKNCWSRHCSGTLKVAVLYTTNIQQAGRMKIEQELRSQYNPPCGDR